MTPTTPIEIVRKEIDDSHYYFVNGEFYPGVTRILDEASPMPYALRQWLLNNTKESAEDIKKTTGDLGSKLHDAYEKLLNKVELDLVNDYSTTKEKKHLVSFYQWYEDTKPTELKTEHTVASVKYKFAGTLDLACKIGDKLCIIDFKSGSAIHYSHYLQLAAYKQAYEEMYGVKIDNVYVLRTGAKTKKGYEFKEVSAPFQAFMNVYNTFLDLHEGKIPEPPLVNVYPDTLKLNI